MLKQGALWLAVLATAAATGPERTETTADRLFRDLGFTAQEREQLRRGEIVSHGVKELSDKELAITVAVLVPRPLEELLEFARSGREFEINRDILSHGSLDATAAGGDGPDPLRNVTFSHAEAEEIRGLLEAGPGSRFNLSAAELARLADLRGRFQPKGCGQDPACVGAVAAEFRDLMRDRLRSYRERGLDGIAPYARPGGGSSNPAEELRRATESARILAERYPAVFDAFLNYPRGDQTGIENHFLWIKQVVQDRPTLILAHRVLCIRDGMAFAAERQFYVGQSYNSLQILYGLIPSGAQTLVFYVNRTSTDQVAGFMTSTRHGMGRRIMEQEIRRHFEQLRAGLEGAK